MNAEINARWTHAVLVCAKCSRKLKGGFGSDGDRKLAKALRRRLGGRKDRKAALGVVEVPCLDVCPKGAVVVVDSRRPDVWRLVRPGADLDALAGELSSAPAQA